MTIYKKTWLMIGLLLGLVLTHTFVQADSESFSSTPVFLTVSRSIGGEERPDLLVECRFSTDGSMIQIRSDRDEVIRQHVPMNENGLSNISQLIYNITRTPLLTITRSDTELHEKLTIQLLPSDDIQDAIVVRRDSEITEVRMNSASDALVEFGRRHCN